MSGSASHPSLFMNVTRGVPAHHLLNKRLDVSHGQSGWFGEQVNLLPVPGFESTTRQPEACPHCCCAVTADTVVLLSPVFKKKTLLAPRPKTNLDFQVKINLEEAQNA